MITKPAAWDAMTDDQRYIRLIRAELARDNALAHLEEITGRATERRQKEVLASQVDKECSCELCQLRRAEAAAIAAVPA
jgi:hypothetical protein